MEAGGPSPVKFPSIAVGGDAGAPVGLMRSLPRRHAGDVRAGLRRAALMRGRRVACGGGDDNARPHSHHDGRVCPRPSCPRGRPKNPDRGETRA